MAGIGWWICCRPPAPGCTWLTPATLTTHAHTQAPTTRIPELLDHRLSPYTQEQRMVFGANALARQPVVELGVDGRGPGRPCQVTLFPVITGKTRTDPITTPGRGHADRSYGRHGHAACD
jgi:hypothetical protein